MTELALGRTSGRWVCECEYYVSPMPGKAKSSLSIKFFIDGHLKLHNTSIVNLEQAATSCWMRASSSRWREKSEWSWVAGNGSIGGGWQMTGQLWSTRHQTRASRDRSGSIFISLSGPLPLLFQLSAYIHPGPISVPPVALELTCCPACCSKPAYCSALNISLININLSSCFSYDVISKKAS